MSTVIETTPRGDVEVETEASRARDARRDAETRARRDCEAARRRETRETCERLVTFLRVVATERGRGMETEVFGGNEGLKHRGRLLKLRVRVRGCACNRNARDDRQIAFGRAVMRVWVVVGLGCGDSEVWRRWRRETRRDWRAADAPRRPRRQAGTGATRLSGRRTAKARRRVDWKIYWRC